MHLLRHFRQRLPGCKSCVVSRLPNVKTNCLSGCYPLETVERVLLTRLVTVAQGLVRRISDGLESIEPNIAFG
jgi:hypothetical protein